MLGMLPNLKIESQVLPMRDLRVEFNRDRKECKSRTLTDRHTRIVLPDGRRLAVSDRFWWSFSSLFNLSRSVFDFFQHDEVFARITQTLNNRARIAFEDVQHGDADGRLLSCTAPTKPLLRVEDVERLIANYDGHDADYGDGIITARFDSPFPTAFQIGGDDFKTQFHLTLPVDGWGLPAAHLALLRLVCANGLVAMTPAFKTQFQLARNEIGLNAVLQRAMETFTNEEGYHSLRSRIESATQSWASLHEAMNLRKAIAGSMKAEGKTNKLEPVLADFDKACGTPLAFYGLTSGEEISARKARSIPIEKTVYDLFNVATEISTHHLTNRSARGRMHAWLGGTLTQEFDLEGTLTTYPEFADYFLARTHVPASAAAGGTCPASSVPPSPTNN